MHVLLLSRPLHILEASLYSRILLHSPQLRQLQTYFSSGHFVYKQSSAHLPNSLHLCVCVWEIVTMLRFLGHNPLRGYCFEWPLRCASFLNYTAVLTRYNCNLTWWRHMLQLTTSSMSVSQKFLSLWKTDEAHEAWPPPHQLITTQQHVITYWGRWVRVQGEVDLQGERSLVW